MKYLTKISVVLLLVTFVSCNKLLDIKETDIISNDVALITDGRFSGGTHGFVIGHITPEAFTGGPLAIVRNGDPITIDAQKRELTLGLSAKEIKQRLVKWKQPKPRYTRGVLAKYAKLVNSAHLGAVTDADL